MKKKRFRKLLGILLCMTVLFTQALPVSFAYAEEAAAGGFGDSPIGEIGADGSETGDSSGVTGEITEEDQTEDQETEPDTDILQEEADLSGNGGEDDGTSDGVGGKEGEKDTSGAGGTEEPSDDPEEKSEEESDISLLEDEEESGVDISWYTEASASRTETASLSTAAQLRGLEALVNGTAVDSEGGTVARENFSGWTITLTADIDLSETDGSGEKTASEWTPIGSSSSISFRGTLDGGNHEISGWKITESTGTYKGFFGYLSGAAIRNLSLTGTIDVDRTASSLLYLAGLAAFSGGFSELSDIDVSMDISCSLLGGTAYIGTLMGYSSSSDTVENCSCEGMIDVQNTASGSSIVYAGGMAGSLYRAGVTDCISSVDITAESNTSNLYAGGIAAYANGTILDRCGNTGDITSGYGDSSSPTTAYAGGIVAYSYGSSSNSTSVIIRNSFNDGDIAAKGTTTAAAGGMIGLQLYGGTVCNSGNAGSIKALLSSGDDAAGAAGGILGTGVHQYVILENCYNAGKVNDGFALSASAMQGAVTACYADAGSAPALLNPESTGSIRGIGTVSSGGTVTAEEGDELLYEDLTDLKGLLNAWAGENVSSDVSYNTWQEDGGILKPTGTILETPSLPSISVSASETAAAAGEPVTLKAEISASAHSLGSSAFSWQWYVSDYSSGKNAIALEGEGASGLAEGSEAEAEYVLNSDEFSDKYYFIVVKHLVTCEGDVNVTLESEAESETVNIIFLNAGDSGYAGATAEEFESGSGTAEDPYLIATPAQLKLMAKMISDNTGASAHYKLTEDIDFNNMRWSPAGEYTSGTSVSVRAFTGSLDGDGHTVSNLRIVAEGNYAGLFGQISTGSVKNLRVEGSMSASGATYAGGIVAHSNNANGSMMNVISDIDIDAADCMYVGGLTGYNTMAVANCVYLGDISFSNTSGSSAYYVGGLTGYMYNGSVKNSVNYGSVSGDRIEGRTGILVGYCRSTSNIIQNCFAEEPGEENGLPLYNNCTTGASGNGTFDSSGQVNAAEGQELAFEGVMDLAGLLNRWVIENADEEGSYNYWISKDGMVLPAGSPVGIFTSTLAVEINASKDTAKAGDQVTLTASISSEREYPENAEVKISYRWFVSDYENGMLPSDLDGEDAAGVLESTSGEITYQISENTYSDRYWFVEVTRTVTYTEGDEILGTVESSSQGSVNVVFTVEDETIYQGETAENYASGNGTAEDPYLIATPAQLKKMNEYINSGEGASAHYKLTADIDFNNVRWTAAGSSSVKFTGSFDGDDHTIRNLRIAPNENYAGMFGYISGGSVSNLTLEGSMVAEGTGYVGGIAGYLENSELSAVTNRMMIDGTNTGLTGGIAGMAVSVSGGTTGMDSCINEGTVSVHLDASVTSPENSLYAGGIVGRLYANSSSGATRLTDSCNSGNVTTDGAVELITIYVGGISGYVGSALSSSVHVINTANYGDVTQNAASSSMKYASGLGYLYLANGSSVRNCVSAGEISTSETNYAICYSLYVYYCANSTVTDCYVKKDDDSNLLYVGTATGSMGNNRIVSGLGYFDEDGNLTAFENYTLNYERSDTVKNAMTEDYSDLLCALNNWAGEQNASDESLSYNSWEAAEGGLLIPAGQPEKSPVSGLQVKIDDWEYSSAIFEKGDELPLMEAKVSGIIGEDNDLTYEWYIARTESGSDRATVTNDGEDPSEYRPDSNVTGKIWYSVDVTAVNRYYFASASSNTVEAQIQSDEGIWEGFAADIYDLNGYGTEAYPYLIENGEILALISEQIAENPAGTPDRENSEMDADKIYQPYNRAYYEITDDIKMDGMHQLPTIGLSTTFMGHVYGRLQEDGTYPTISGLVISSSANGNSSYCGLFGNANLGSEFKNFNIEDAVITSSATNTGVLVGYMYSGTISNVRVSGNISGSSSYMGGIAGRVGGTTLVENCVSEVSVTNNTGTGGTMGGNSYTGTGGITGDASNNTVIQSCLNTGTVTGRNAGGIAGGMNNTASYQSMGGTITIKECVNTGMISSSTGAGGIVGVYSPGFSAILTLENCCNRGEIVVTGTGTANSSVYAGGVAGCGFSSATRMTMENCYNTGSVRGTSTTTDYTKLGGLSGGNVSTVNNCFYMTGCGADCALGTASTEPSTVTALTSDEMKSAATAVSLGDAWIIAADGYPLLEWEPDAAEICTVTAAAADETGGSGGDTENAPSVQIKVGDTVVSSLRAQTDAGFDVEVVTDSDGYSVSSVQVKIGDDEPQTLTKNADGTYTLSVTGDLALLASMQQNPYTVQLKDVTQQNSGQTGGSDAGSGSDPSQTGEETAYQAGEEILLDLIVKATEEGKTVQFAAVEAEVTFDPELLEYTGNSAGDPSGDGDASGTDIAESVIVSEEETPGTLKITRISSNTTADSEGVSVVTLTFRVLNRLSADSVQTEAGVSAAVGPQGTDPDLNDASQLAVPESAVIILAPSQVVFITDYAAAPSGYKLTAYRTALALEDGTSLLYDGETMMHASAFDGRELIPVEDSGEEISGETATEVSGNVTIGESTDDVIYTYIYFVEDDTEVSDAIGSMSFGEGSCIEVDYEDYDITENSVINIFDAQRVWDLFSYETFTGAMEFIQNPGMYQRLHADVNQDSSVDVMDALLIQRYLHFGSEDEAADAQVNDAA